MENLKIVPLSKEKHASLTFTPLADYSFTAERNSVPLLPIELDQASRCFPIFFPDLKRPVPYALLGLGKKNVFLNPDGSWGAPYLPLVFANYPFSLIMATFKDESDTDERKPEVALAIDEDAPHFREKGGKPLFDENKEPTELLKSIKGAIIAQYSSYQTMRKALAKLTLHDPFSTDPISVRYKGKSTSIGGIRTVSRKKISSLPDSTLGQWVKSGLMEFLYAHWHSLLNFSALLDDPSCPQAMKSNPPTEQQQ